MLQAPVSESRQRNSSRTQLSSERGQEVHPLFDSFSRGSPTLARLHSSYGNQAVLRILSRPAPAIQPELTVNQPGDQYEQQADRMADHVMRMPEPGLQRACACGGSGGECPARKKKDEAGVQRAANGSSGLTQAPTIVHEVLHSPGQPLDLATRAFMEPRFGRDFGGVRVHNDLKAAESTRAVNALAYTVGHHTVFGSGRYQPGSSSGRQLIAHELMHVVQQSGNLAPVLARQQGDEENGSTNAAGPTDAGLPGGVSTPPAPDTSGDGTTPPATSPPAGGGGAAVQVCARPLQISPVGNHTYIDAPPFRYAIISPTCPQKWSDNPATGTGGQKWDNSPDPCGKTPTCIDCAPAPGVTDVNKCLRDAFTAYNNPSLYKLLGPNSNTFAGTLARACCDGMIPKPPAFGWCPGWDDSPAAAYGSPPCPPGPTC